MAREDTLDTLIADLYQKAAASRLTGIQMRLGGIRAMLRRVAHLLFLFCPWRLYYSQTETKWANTKDGERSDCSLSGHFHKARGWSITSTFQNCIGLTPTCLVYKKNPQTTGLIEKPLTPNQRAHVCSLEITCHFLPFLEHIRSLLSSLIPLPPPSLSPSSRSVWTLHTAQVLCYCTPLHACNRVTQRTQQTSGGRNL